MLEGVEMLRPEAIQPGDRVLVPTSGHCPGCPDTPADVVEIVGELALVLHLRLCDGRDVFYAPGRSIRRVAARC